MAFGCRLEVKNESELIAKDGKGHVVRRFQTGLWHRQYSKEYFL